MNRHEIYEGLREIIPYLKRRGPTPRVCQESGMDALLDKLLELEMIELNQEVERLQNDLPNDD